MSTCPAVVKTQTHLQHVTTRPRPSASPPRTAQPKTASKLSAQKRKEAQINSLREKFKARRGAADSDGPWTKAPHPARGRRFQIVDGPGGPSRPYYTSYPTPYYPTTSYYSLPTLWQASTVPYLR